MGKKKVKARGKEKKELKKRLKVKKRRRKKKLEKLNKWSGVILFVLVFLIGVLLWLGGEVRENKSAKVKSKNNKKNTREVQDEGVIIIE